MSVIQVLILIVAVLLVIVNVFTLIYVMFILKIYWSDNKAKSKENWKLP